MDIKEKEKKLLEFKNTCKNKILELSNEIIKEKVEKKIDSKIYSNIVPIHEMQNYCWVWFLPKGIVYESAKKLNNIIYSIILKNTYPSCINPEYKLTKEEQNKIINDEQEYLNELCSFYNVRVIKIPRTLYDLFNIYFQINFSYKYNKNTNYISFDLDSTKNYWYNIERVNNNKFEGIGLLPIEINTNLSKMINLEIDLIDQYKKIFNIIYQDIFILYDKIISENKIKLIGYHGLVAQPDDTHPLFINILDKPNINITLERNINIIKLFFTYELENLYKKELNPYIYIFRGAKDDYEGSIKLTNKNVSYSNSYNTSILNGFLNDDTACTLKYFSKNNFKQCYKIKKFFENDNSLESKLFSIPAFYPAFLINLKDEFWHVRTKIPAIKNPENIVNGIDGIKRVGDVPLHLVSTLTDEYIKEVFDKIIILNRYQIINKDYKKYLKYKTKYLELKKYSKN